MLETDKAVRKSMIRMTSCEWQVHRVATARLGPPIIVGVIHCRSPKLVLIAHELVTDRDDQTQQDRLLDMPYRNIGAQ